MKNSKKNYSKKRKIYRKKNNYTIAKRNNRLIIPRGGLPQNFLCKMVYTHSGSLVGGSNDTSQYDRWRAFSVYDPYFPSIGTGNHNCVNYPTMSALYGNYRTLSSKVSVTLQSYTSNSGVLALLYSDADGTYSVGTRASFDVLRGNPKVKFAQQALGGNPIKLSLTHSSKKIFGDDAENMTTSVNDNPLNDRIISLIVHPAASVDTVNCMYTIQIEYIVLFSNLIDQTT